MDFGKVSFHPGIDFTLAPIVDARPARAPDPQTASQPLRLYLGCPVWNHARWGKRVYREGASAKGRLRSYAETYNSVEVNATFYGIPTIEAVRSWKSDVPGDFRFALKIPRSISHDAPLTESGPALEAFLESAEALEDRLGVVFLQLPPQFDWERRSELISFCRGFPAHLKLAIEFRHPSWFKDRQLDEGAARWFGERRRSIVITDTPGRREVSHGTLTAEFAMVRFLGNEMHPNDDRRVKAWARRLSELRDKGVREVYFYAHQPGEDTCPDWIESFASELGRMGLSVDFRVSPPPGDGQYSLSL